MTDMQAPDALARSNRVLRTLRATDEQALLRTMGHRVSRRGIGEGILDERAWRALADEGCDAVQDYHVGRPLPVGEFKAWANASRWHGPTAAGRLSS